MPVKTGLSHAFVAVVTVSAYVLFTETLKVVVGKEQIESGVYLAAQYVAANTALSVTHGLALTVLSMGVFALAAFTWGYLFHKSRF